MTWPVRCPTRPRAFSVAQCAVSAPHSGRKWPFRRCMHSPGSLTFRRGGPGLPPGPCAHAGADKLIRTPGDGHRTEPFPSGQASSASPDNAHTPSRRNQRRCRVQRGPERFRPVPAFRARCDAAQPRVSSAESRDQGGPKPAAPKAAQNKHSQNHYVFRTHPQESFRAVTSIVCSDESWGSRPNSV